MHYERNDVDFHRGVFRVRGDRVEIFPAYEEERAIRVDYFGDEIEAILDARLPEHYNRDIFNQTCGDVYQHIYDNYAGAGESTYAAG